MNVIQIFLTNAKGMSNTATVTKKKIFLIISLLSSAYSSSLSLFSSPLFLFLFLFALQTTYSLHFLSLCQDPRPPTLTQLLAFIITVIKLCVDTLEDSAPIDQPQLRLKQQQFRTLASTPSSSSSSLSVISPSTSPNTSSSSSSSTASSSSWSSPSEPTPFEKWLDRKQLELMKGYAEKPWTQSELLHLPREWLNTYVQFCKYQISPDKKARDYASEGRFLEHFDKIGQLSSRQTPSSSSFTSNPSSSSSSSASLSSSSSVTSPLSRGWTRASEEEEGSLDEEEEVMDEEYGNNFKFQSEDEDEGEKVGEGEEEEEYLLRKKRKRDSASSSPSLGSCSSSSSTLSWPASSFCFYERDSHGDVHKRYEFVLRICCSLADVSFEKLQNTIWMIQRVLIHDAMGVGRPNPRQKGKGDLPPLVLKRGQAYQNLLKQVSKRETTQRKEDEERGRRRRRDEAQRETSWSSPDSDSVSVSKQQHRTKLRLKERATKQRNAKTGNASSTPTITQKGVKMCTKCHQPWRRYHLCG
jgi:hypothetical protein